MDGAPLRDRSGETLFIDARKLGYMEDRTRRNLSGEDIELITGTYHAWRGDGHDYMNRSGFCQSATREDIQANGYVLTPGRYVGAEAQKDDGVSFNENMSRLAAELRQQITKSHELDATIEANLASLGYVG